MEGDGITSITNAIVDVLRGILGTIKNFLVGVIPLSEDLILIGIAVGLAYLTKLSRIWKSPGVYVLFISILIYLTLKLI